MRPTVESRELLETEPGRVKRNADLCEMTLWGSGDSSGRTLSESNVIVPDLDILPESVSGAEMRIDRSFD